MSQTQLSTDQITELVLSFTEEECRTRAEKVCPVIMKNLQQSSCTVQDTIQISNVVANKLLSVLFYDRFGREILAVVFSQLTLKFNEVISRLPDEEKKSIDQVSSVIITCLQNAIKVVQCMEKLLQSILSTTERSDSSNLVDISFIPISVLGVLQNSYLHCKNSEKSYANLFKPASDALSILFQQTYSLQKTWSVILTKLDMSIPDHEIMDTASDLNPIFRICDGLIEICRITKSLDNTLLASSWKLLLRFISRFRHTLEGHILLPVYVELLCENVVDNVKYTTQLSISSSHLIMQDDIPTKQAFTHSCKLSQFFITALTSILNDFKHSVDSCVCDIFVSCILHLFEILKSPMQNKNFNDNPLDRDFVSVVIDEIDKIVSCMNDFESFFNSITSLAEEKSQAFVQLLLLLSINKSLTEKNISIWMPGTDSDDTLDQKSIFFLIFQKYSQVYHDLSRCLNPSMVLTDKGGLTLYDTVFISLCSVTSQIPSSQYPCIEKFLFDEIFSLNPCKSTLANDVLVFICKSVPAMSSHYTIMLLQFLEKAGENSRPLLSYPCQNIAFLVQRILQVMPSNQRREFCSRLPDKGILTSEFLGPLELVIRQSKKLNAEMNTWISSECKLALLPPLTLQTCKLEESFHELQLSHGQSLPLQLPESLNAMKELFGTVMRVWTFIPLEEHDEYFKSLIVRRFIPALTEISGILSKTMSHPNTDQIVKNLHQLGKNKDCDMTVLLSIASILPAFLHSSSSVFCKDKISAIYSRLLRCVDWRVRNASMCSLEMIVKAPSGSFLVEHCAKVPENYFGFEEYLSRTTHLPENLTANRVIQQLHENFIKSDGVNSCSLWKGNERRMCSQSLNEQSLTTKFIETDTFVMNNLQQTANILRDSVVNMREVIDHCLQEKGEKCVSFSEEVMQSLVKSRTDLDDIIKLLTK